MNSCGRLDVALAYARHLAAADYVYVIGTGRTGEPVKVGVTRDPKVRLQTLRQSRPDDDLRILYQRDCSSIARRVERAVHCALRPHVIVREWYSLPWREAAAVVEDTFERIQQFDERSAAREAAGIQSSP